MILTHLLSKTTQQWRKHTLPTCPLLLVALVELPPLFHSLTGHSEYWEPRWDCELDCITVSNELMVSSVDGIPERITMNKFKIFIWYRNTGVDHAYFKTWKNLENLLTNAYIHSLPQKRTMIIIDLQISNRVPRLYLENLWLTFYMCKCTKWPSGTVSSLSHIIAFGRFVDLRERQTNHKPLRYKLQN